MRSSIGLLNKALHQKAPLAYKHLGVIGYSKALFIQDKIQAIRKPQLNSGASDRQSRRADPTFDTDVILLLQHPPTYTEGRRHKALDPEQENKLRGLGAEYFKVLITYAS